MSKSIGPIFIEGTPKGQPRPRAFSHNGSARVYDPGTAEGWKSCIAAALRAELPASPIEGPINLCMEFRFARPKGHVCQKGLRSSAPTKHTQKPDLDNLIKAVKDCCSDIGVWRDDSQIDVYGQATKRWAEPGEKSGMWLTIYAEC